ncbi:hypothetical protein D8M04_04965 [Oceanobacillus piezotolerans]|uniref:Uncharacterized protein n=1 Tax=Oceanobacillus piezotolerans TaxID=2448030 RepID=A0A498DJC7_9BACI|nr:hypothetical protein [Oceanobacillus piezotolerans]RLL46562.1 hypothetical protein D8M04_04965 [Oceanobacillus piezotolerans]
MRKAAMICFIFLILTGFDNADDLIIKEMDITIDPASNELRYDFLIENTGEKPIKSDFDYPGQHPLGVEFVVQPNRTLAPYMELEPNSKYKKMLLLERGSTSYFEPGVESPFYLSYKIKDDADLNRLEKQAFHAKLLIIDGVNVSAEFPLKEWKEEHKEKS